MRKDQDGGIEKALAKCGFCYVDRIILICKPKDGSQNPRANVCSDRTRHGMDTTTVAEHINTEPQKKTEQ